MNILTQIKKKLQKFSDTLKKRREEARKNALFKREYYPTYISQRAKWRVNILRKTKYLDRSQKELILPKVRKLSVKISRLNLIEDRIFYIRQILEGYVIWLLVFGLGGLSYQSLTTAFYGHIRLLSTDILYGSITSSILLFVYVYYSNRAFSKIKFQRQLMIKSIILFLSFGILAISTNLNISFPITIGEYIIYSIIYGIFGFTTISFIVNVIDIVLIFLIERFGYNDLPEGVVVNNILKVLDGVERVPLALSELEFKTWACNCLDYAAMSMSRDIPILLRTRNSEFNKMAKLISNSIANAINAKKQWVFTPKDDTYKYLATYLANFLFHFVKGDWDLLERIDAPELSLYEKWSKRYLPVLRPIIFIGVPIAALWAFYKSSLINEAWAGTVISYIVLWIIINLIWLIDPSAKEKISSLKDTAGLF